MGRATRHSLAILTVQRSDCLILSPLLHPHLHATPVYILEAAPRLNLHNVATPIRPLRQEERADDLYRNKHKHNWYQPRFMSWLGMPQILFIEFIDNGPATTEVEQSIGQLRPGWTEQQRQHEQEREKGWHDAKEIDEHTITWRDVAQY